MTDSQLRKLSLSRNIMEYMYLNGGYYPSDPTIAKLTPPKLDNARCAEQFKSLSKSMIDTGFSEKVTGRCVHQTCTN